MKIYYVKVILKNSFNIGVKPQLKLSSRIDIWGKEGNISIGDFFSMGHNSEIYSWDDQITIGSQTSFNDNCKIYGKVVIGSNCLFASNIFVSSGTHNFSTNKYLPIKAQDKLKTVVELVTIEDDCWIGFGVVIMPGVYIGKGSIIGANAVVTKDVYPYTIHGGVPSKEIGKRLDFKDVNNILNSNELKHIPYFYKGFNYNQYDQLDTIKDGIQVIKNSVVFLLAKVPMRKIKIIGFNNVLDEFEISVNNTLKNSSKIRKGNFEIILDLFEIGNEKCPDFESLSIAIKQDFNVVIFKSNVDSVLKNSSKILCKIISIGLHYD